MSDDKVIPFPAKPEADAGEAEVMILLGGAADARLVSIAIIGLDAEGNVFEASNATELEQVGMHFTATLGLFFED